MYRGTASLAGEATIMDKTFVLLFRCSDPRKGVVVVEKGVEGTEEVAVMTSFTPQFETKPILCEFVFLVSFINLLGQLLITIP